MDMLAPAEVPKMMKPLAGSAPSAEAFFAAYIGLVSLLGTIMPGNYYIPTATRPTNRLLLSETYALAQACSLH